MILLVASALVAAATAGLLLWARTAEGAARPRLVDGSLALLALASIGVWTDLGRFQANGRFVHEWEMFHYQLSASYYRELGHDGLYAASLQAQSETLPSLPMPAVTRDLRTNALARTQELRAHAEEVKARFTPQRWHDFLRDHAVHLGSILEQGGPGWLERIRRDHGFNATPAWVAAARLFGAGLPATEGSLARLALIDPLLLALAFLALWRTYGRRVALTALIVFGTGHAWSFHWVGGALLRFDWFVALALAACACKTDRWGSAGALVGYATLVRLFPAAFLLGPCVHALRSWRRTRSPRLLARMLGGFGAMLLLGAIAGSATGRGPGAWADFARNIRKHSGIWLTNNVGLPIVVDYDARVLSGRFGDAGDEWGEHLDANRERRMPAYLVLAALLVGAQAIACWRLPPDQALAGGVAAVFAPFALTCYYWVMLVLLCVRGRPAVACALLASSVLVRLLDAGLGLPLESAYGAYSWVLLLVLGGLAASDARATLRARENHRAREAA